MTFLFPQPERRARPGSRDPPRLQAEARESARGAAERWLLQRGIRPAAGSRPAPRPRCSLTMRPVSRRTLDWTYSAVGTGVSGAPASRMPQPTGGRPKACSALWTPKPIPNLSDHALPSAPPLPGGHALPPLTSGCGACPPLQLPPVCGWEPGLSREPTPQTFLLALPPLF